MLNWSKFLIFFGLVASLTGVIYVFGIYFSLFWLITWFDIPTHIFGGFLSALFVFTIWYFFKKPNLKENGFFLPVLIGTLLIATIWEFYEYYAGLIYEKDLDYVLDIIYDFLNAILGVIMAFYYLKYFFLKDYNKDSSVDEAEVI